MYWLLLCEMDTMTRIQILAKAVNNSHSANTLKKGMNPTIRPPTMGEIVSQTKQPVLEKENSLIQSC